MTQNEFNKFIQTLTDVTDIQYAYEYWDSLTENEKTKCTANDIINDIQCTYESVDEMEV